MQLLQSVWYLMPCSGRGVLTDRLPVGHKHGMQPPGRGSPGCALVRHHTEGPAPLPEATRNRAAVVWRLRSGHPRRSVCQDSPQVSAALSVTSSVSSLSTLRHFGKSGCILLPCGRLGHSSSAYLHCNFRPESHCLSRGTPCCRMVFSPCSLTAYQSNAWFDVLALFVR